MRKVFILFFIIFSVGCSSTNEDGICVQGVRAGKKPNNSIEFSKNYLTLKQEHCNSDSSIVVNLHQVSSFRIGRRFSYKCLEFSMVGSEVDAIFCFDSISNKQIEDFSKQIKNYDAHKGAVNAENIELVKIENK